MICIHSTLAGEAGGERGALAALQPACRQLLLVRHRLHKSEDGSGQIPFGPFLAVAAPFMFLWGDALFALYVKFVFGE